MSMNLIKWGYKIESSSKPSELEEKSEVRWLGKPPYWRLELDQANRMISMNLEE